jgi:(2Fe-2S) ferredoxin
MSYYKYHMFFCTNQREDGRACCGNHNAQAMRDYAKHRTKQLKLAGPGGVRVSNAGCMDRCSEGPCIVIYPQAVWYTYRDQSDVEEIIQEHLVGGRLVERLRLKDAPV